MKKIIFTIMVLLATQSALLRAQSIGVFTWDSKGKYTNVRNAPNGKVVDRIPTSDAAMIGIEKPTNGWWKIIGNHYDTGDVQGTLKGSDSGLWALVIMANRN